MSEWITVARAEELAPGERRITEVDDAQIAVFNLDTMTRAVLNITNDHVHPLIQELPCHSEAETARATGDKSGLANKIIHPLHAGVSF